jgi:hypothetical protein
VLVHLELSCERCLVVLRAEDVDSLRDAGICPRCGDLVRGKAVREVGYRTSATASHQQVHESAPISLGPSSAHGSALSSRSLSWWSEMPLLDGGTAVRVTSDAHAIMPKLLASLVLLLCGMGVLGMLLTADEARPPPGLVVLGMVFVLGGGVTLGRGLVRLGRTATFTFRGDSLHYASGSMSRSLPTMQVLRFRPRMTEMGATSVRQIERVYTIEIVTAQSVVVVPVALTCEPRVHALIARLDALLRDAQSTSSARRTGASSHPAAPSPPP